MVFDLLLGMKKEETENRKVYHREAVRAVVIEDEMIFMVHTVNGDYKFPGGGVENGETHEDALRRELLEETGCEIGRFGRKLGQIVERRADYLEPENIFEMVSHYYLCGDAKNVGSPSLSPDEKELCLTACWLKIEEAFENNEKICREKTKMREWIRRESTVLKILTDHYKDLAKDEKTMNPDPELHGRRSLDEKADQRNDLLE